MAIENVSFAFTLQALEDLSGSQYKAVALNDGLVANNGEEASGIIYNKPESGEMVEFHNIGMCKFAAGGAIAKGAKVTVTTSGWFTTAGSLECVVGEAVKAVTSGSVGTGMFSFPNAQTPATGTLLSVTANCGFLAGIGVSLDDGEVANNSEECNGVAPNAVSSGDTGNIVVAGLVSVHIDPAQVASAGDWLRATTSGYFTPSDSGYYSTAIALANIGSDAVGAAIISHQGYLSV